jgi:DNA repair protein RadC
LIPDLRTLEVLNLTLIKHDKTEVVFMASSHPHDGHRDRLRKKFVENGLGCLEEHEILEMILFYSVPRKNTNELAHKLIDKFGSLAKVLDADIDLLTETDGVSFNSAVLLKMLPSVFRFYAKQNNDKAFSFQEIEALSQFCINQYIGETEEVLKVIYLDHQCRLISCVEICRGNNSFVAVNASKIIELSNKYKSNNIILTHNHPNASVRPSIADKSTTSRLYKIFDELHINLLDHVIVSGEETFSMLQNGCLNFEKK